MKKGIIFTVEILVVLLIVTLTFRSLYMYYEPARQLELYRMASDSLSLMKLTGVLQSMDESDMRDFLDGYLQNWRLSATTYNPGDLSIDQSFMIGDAPNLKSSTASISFITDGKFGKASLEVWD